VLCRNVVMYFTVPLQQRAHRLLHESLVHFGYLGLGRRETVSEPMDALYALTDGREKIYRKVA
jgi:chemotaxis protein methyltransferase CheR